MGEELVNLGVAEEDVVEDHADEAEDGVVVEVVVEVAEEDVVEAEGVAEAAAAEDVEEENRTKSL